MSTHGTCPLSCPLAGNCGEASQINQRLRSCANCIIQYLAQYDGYVAEDQLLLALDKLRFFTIIGKMHLSLLADKGGDNYDETMGSIEEAAAKLQEFCDNIWHGIMAGCEGEGEESGESETSHSSKKKKRSGSGAAAARKKKQPYLLAKMPEWPKAETGQPGQCKDKDETPES